MEMVLEAAHYVVLNKPNGLLVEHSPWYDSLQDQVLQWVSIRTKKPYVGIVHRLDRVVSGVVLMALRKSALTALQQQFEQRQTRKTYLALVQGQTGQASGTLLNFLLENKQEKRSSVVKAGVLGAKEAVLHFQIAKTYAAHTLLEIQLETGRFHQIRAQLAHAGWPILNDVKYGAVAVSHLAETAIGLHALRLEFTDPVAAHPISVEAPLPQWWQKEFPD